MPIIELALTHRQELWQPAKSSILLNGQNFDAKLGPTETVPSPTGGTYLYTGIRMFDQSGDPLSDKSAGLFSLPRGVSSKVAYIRRPFRCIDVVIAGKGTVLVGNKWGDLGMYQINTNNSESPNIGVEYSAGSIVFYYSDPNQPDISDNIPGRMTILSLYQPAWVETPDDPLGPIERELTLGQQTVDDIVIPSGFWRLHHRIVNPRNEQPHSKAEG